MARRRGARRLIHPSGVARPIDGVLDVGPAAEPPVAPPPAPTDVALGESLEDRQERWFRERDRRERRIAAEPPRADPPD